MNYLFKNVLVELESLKFKKHLILPILLLALVSIFYSSYLSIIILSLPLSYAVMSKVLTKRLFSSKILVGIVSFIAYVAILQMSFFIGWFIYREVNLLESSLIGLFLTLVLLILVWKKESPKRRPLATRTDIVAIVAMLIFCIPFLGIPVYKTAKEGNPAPLLTLITSAFDDSSHLGMLNDRIQFDRGVLAGTSEAKNSRYDGVIYPAGWHSANAVFAKAFNPDIKPGIQTANYYALNKSMWFIVLCFIFVRMAGIILERTKKKPSVLSLSTLVFAGVGVMAIFLADTYITGFYSFIPVIITSCLLVPSLFEFYRIKNPDEAITSLILPSLLISLSTLSWLLVLPMYCLAILFIGFERYKYIFAKKGWGLKPILILCFLAIIVGLSTLAQIKVSSTGTGAVSFVDGILIPGGIITYGPGFYVLCIALLIAFIVSVKKRYSTPAILYLTGIILFVAIIYAIQQYKNQANTYYFFKSLAVFITAAFVFGVGALSILVDRFKLKSKMTSIVVGVSLPLVLIMTLVPNPTTFTFVNGKRTAPTGVYKQIYNELTTNYTINHYNDKQITLFYPSNSPILNEVGSMSLKVNRSFNSCWTLLKTNSFNIKSADFNTNILNDPLCRDFGVKYYVNEQDLVSFKEKIEQAQLSDRVTLETLDNSNALISKPTQ